MSYPIENGRYERNGQVRSVSGVRRIGQGGGSALDQLGHKENKFDGMVWWYEPGPSRWGSVYAGEEFGDREYSCTVAEFAAWLGIPTPPWMESEE